MVIRDVPVRSVASAPQEVVEARSTSSSTSTNVKKVREVEENVVLLDDVQFVDKDNAGDPAMNGTAEHPWDEVNEGVAAASGGVIVDTLTGAGDSFTSLIEGNQFINNSEAGLVLDTRGGSGPYDVLLKDNEFIWNGFLGLGVDARAYETARLEVDGAVASGNDDCGIWIEEVFIRRPCPGGLAGIILNDIAANENYGDGIHIERGAVVTAGGDAILQMTNIEASNNSHNGIYVARGAMAGNGMAMVELDSITATWNVSSGILIYRGAVVSDDG